MDEIDAVTLEDIDVVCKRISDFRAYSGAVISNSKIDIKRMMQI
jgi:hypothetical protein